MASPEQYVCKDCKACWAERKAKRCLICLSKNIKMMWNPNKKGKERWPT
jgi:hypothetical protein